jgi:hypothetical protein
MFLIGGNYMLSGVETEVAWAPRTGSAIPTDVIIRWRAESSVTLPLIRILWGAQVMACSSGNVTSAWQMCRHTVPNPKEQQLYRIEVSEAVTRSPNVIRNYALPGWK